MVPRPAEAARLTKDDPARGALFVLGAAAAFSTMSALLKSASVGLPTEMLVFLRNAFSLLFLLPFLVRLRWAGLATQVPHLHLLRAVVGVTGIYLFVYALGHLPLAEAVLLNLTSALFVPFIAMLWLDERIARRTAAALVLGFVGVVLILKPGGGFGSFDALVGLGSGLTTALAMVTIRRNSRTEPYQRIVFYFFTLATLVSAVPLLWAWVTPDLRQFAVLAAAGLCATLGQLALTKGYSLAPVSRVGPYTYASVVFAAAWGWALWGEAPDALAAGGALFVIAGGILALPRPGAPAPPPA